MIALEIVASIAEIVAGLAIVGAAVKAWPLVNHLETAVGRRQGDRKQLQRGFDTLVSALDELREEPCPKIRNARQAVECFVETVTADRAIDYYFDILNDPDHADDPGVIQRSVPPGKLEVMCRLPMASYVAILEELRARAGVDRDAPSAGTRLVYGDLTLALDFAAGLDGPLCRLVVMHNEMFVATPAELQIQDTRMWNVVEPVLEQRQGFVVIVGEPGSGKVTTATALMNHFTETHTARCIALVEDADFPLRRVVQLSLGTGDTQTKIRTWTQALAMGPDFVYLNYLTDELIPQVWRAYGGPQIVVTSMNGREAVAGLMELNRHGLSTYQAIEWPIVLVGQRLVRELCSACKQRRDPDLETKANLERVVEAHAVAAPGLDLPGEYYEPVGCEQCKDGFARRLIALHETLFVDQTLQDAASKGAGLAELRDMAIASGMVSMQMSAIELASQGRIVLDVVREVSRDLDYSVQP